jgi:histidine triad (HIT) family protein
MVDNMDCIFCKIASGQLSTELLAQNQHAVAFRDINPQAPVHILCVPRVHCKDVSELSSDDELAGLFSLIRQVAQEQTDGQFRLQFNTGEREGQSVFHVHAHVLSSRAN